MDKTALDALHEDLREALAARLNVRARSFQGAVRRAGRLLPAQARLAAAEMSALEARLAHPKLAARTDPALVVQAADRFRAALAGQRPGARAARDRSFLMAEIGFKLALLIGLGLAFLHWQIGA
ncbi:hypothetical protein [Roseicyclus mahoneyensis]|uniref:Uncharacterized protein n=1 Tax=Roseicyclus mahoneyensis TaxID=164332 RepID=A0A316GK33_9RHOB|nr:hypothetical protein [Roseicyclus mahoneyensis]PWK60915.1 hypothetical protein C7455_103113 [Roseicyclus mahoneyensis]